MSENSGHDEERARCVDGKLAGVLGAFGFFPGDRVEVDEHGLTAYRMIAGGESEHPLGDVYDPPAVRLACDRWLETRGVIWWARAEGYAIRAHGNQLYGAEPYIVHPREVHAILEELGLDAGALGPAAVLHDVIEDTGTPRPELERAFGYEVAFLVDSVSKGKGPRDVTTQLSNEKIRDACRTSGNDRPASLKLADKIANVRRSRKNRPDLFAMYLGEQPAFSAMLEEEGLGDPRLWRMLAEAFGS